MLPVSRTTREGAVVGLIGYASVALFYSVFDMLAARGTLYTVDLLGRTVFRGLRDTGILLFPIERDIGAILMYNALHFVVALAIGLIVTGLVHFAEQHPSRAPLVLIIIVAGFVATILTVGMLTTAMRSVLPWWSIVVANAFAAIVAGSYLLQRRPGLWRRLVPRSLTGTRP